MSERIQLKNAGDELAMAVKTVTTESIENTDYVKFADGKSDLLVPLSSVERQLERLGAEKVADLAGKSIKFSRSTKLSKYGKPFWNLDPASPSDLKPAASSKRLTHAEASGDLPGDLAIEHYEREPGEEAPDGPSEAEQVEQRRKESRHRNYAAYKALWRDCAAFQREVCGSDPYIRDENKPAAERSPERIPYDASSVNQMAAAVWIGWDKNGLVPK